MRDALANSKLFIEDGEDFTYASESALDSEIKIDASSNNTF